MVSSKYFDEVKDGACLKLRPTELAMSVNVTGDCACGAGGGGFVVGISEL
jgi:hypothetical protein